MRRTVCMAARSAALALGIALGLPGAAHGSLETAGFRAVGVALSENPISAMAVAPDGRLFAAVQHLDQQSDPETPVSAEIRVYQAYTAGDGSTLDRGTLWATIDDLRAISGEEGLLGIALAPDFATSKLVYVYVTTTSDDANQHVRVFRENAAGIGEYLGTVMDDIEPPNESTTRNGGPLAFGVDGCLYLGVGDNGNNNRWNSQVLIGTDQFSGAENDELCTDVCLGNASWPDRPSDTDGEMNHAGKLLRMAVEGPSIAQPAAAPPLADQPFMFAGGLRSPTGIAVHPLTGQIYVADRGETQASEIDVIDRASNSGWPFAWRVIGPASRVAARPTALATTNRSGLATELHTTTTWCCARLSRPLCPPGATGTIATSGTSSTVELRCCCDGRRGKRRRPPRPMPTLLDASPWRSEDKA